MLIHTQINRSLQLSTSYGDIGYIQKKIIYIRIKVFGLGIFTNVLIQDNI